MEKIILLLLIPSASFAVKFKCTQRANSMVQVYEYASSECATQNSGKDVKKNREANLQKNPSANGEKDIVCLYQAFCQLQDSPVSVPKESTLMCLGKGRVDDRGLIADAHCPEASLCQEDVMFNRATRENASPKTDKPFTVETLGGRQ